MGSCLAPHIPQKGSPGPKVLPQSGQNIIGFGFLVSSSWFGHSNPETRPRLRNANEELRTRKTVSYHTYWFLVFVWRANRES
jgi:hypothetical protein